MFHFQLFSSQCGFICVALPFFQLQVFFLTASCIGEYKCDIMADSKPMMVLFDNRDRCFKAYEIYLVYSAKYEHQDTWTKTVLLDKIVPHLPNLNQDNELRVLGVGSGSGEAMFQIIRCNNNLL